MEGAKEPVMLSVEKDLIGGNINIKERQRGGVA